MSPPLQEPDRVGRRAIAWVALASLVVVAGSLAAVVGLLGGSGKQAGEARPAPSTIGSLEQSLVLDARRGTKLRAEQRAELDRVGWIDRDAGVARIPIDRAMDLVARDGGGP